MSTFNRDLRTQPDTESFGVSHGWIAGSKTSFNVDQNRFLEPDNYFQIFSRLIKTLASWSKNKPNPQAFRRIQHGSPFKETRPALPADTISPAANLSTISTRNVEAPQPASVTLRIDPERAGGRMIIELHDRFGIRVREIKRRPDVSDIDTQLPPGKYMFKIWADKLVDGEPVDERRNETHEFELIEGQRVELKFPKERDERSGIFGFQ